MACQRQQKILAAIRALIKLLRAKSSGSSVTVWAHQQQQSANILGSSCVYECGLWHKVSDKVSSFVSERKWNAQNWRCVVFLTWKMMRHLFAMSARYWTKHMSSTQGNTRGQANNIWSDNTGRYYLLLLNYYFYCMALFVILLTSIQGNLSKSTVPLRLSIWPFSSLLETLCFVASKQGTTRWLVCGQIRIDIFRQRN